jgi:hypothetical protein
MVKMSPASPVLHKKANGYQHGSRYAYNVRAHHCPSLLGEQAGPYAERPRCSSLVVFWTSFFPTNVDTGGKKRER